MKYGRVVKADFISRPNRFIAEVMLDGVKETVHVKNTGRCRELLISGSTVYLEDSFPKQRKTRYDLIAVEKKLENDKIKLVNMDSQAPNKAVGEWLKEHPIFGEPVSVRPEVTVGGSRFDFGVVGSLGSGYLEVKGVTLEDDGVVLFPDAPTKRGVKHLSELTDLAKRGVMCAVMFVVQMSNVKYFKPNRRTDPDFADALALAANAGVRIIAVECRVEPDSMVITKEIEVRLD